MKKKLFVLIASIILVALLAVSLAGCGVYGRTIERTWQDAEYRTAVDKIKIKESCIDNGNGASITGTITRMYHDDKAFFEVDLTARALGFVIPVKMRVFYADGVYTFSIDKLFIMDNLAKGELSAEILQGYVSCGNDMLNLNNLTHLVDGKVAADDALAYLLDDLKKSLWLSMGGIDPAPLLDKILFSDADVSFEADASDRPTYVKSFQTASVALTEDDLDYLIYNVDNFPVAARDIIAQIFETGGIYFEISGVGAIGAKLLTEDELKLELEVSVESTYSYDKFDIEKYRF